MSFREELPYTTVRSAGTPYTLFRECYNALMPFLGSATTVRSAGAYVLLWERYNALMPLLEERYLFWEKFWFVEKNEGKIPSISEGGWIRILGQAMILGKIHN
jgi:hypothetical protein